MPIISIFWVWWERCGFCEHHSIQYEKTSTHSLYSCLPTWEKLWAEEVSLGTELWLPWGKDEMHIVKLYSQIFLFQWYAGILNSQKVFLSMSSCQNQCSGEGQKQKIPIFPSCWSHYLITLHLLFTPLFQSSLHLIDHFCVKLAYILSVHKYSFLAFFSGYPIVYNTYL